MRVSVFGYVDAAPSGNLLCRRRAPAGPTEFTVNATTALLPPGAVAAPLGPPDPNVRAYVVDPANFTQLQPVGVPGELLLSGPRLARGYCGRPDLTAEMFPANPFMRPQASAAEKGLYGRVYRTGDLASWDGEGNLRFHGRADRQVKLHGVRIELAEVEAALASAPGVVAAAAVAVASGRGQVLVGMVAPASVDASAALAQCRRVLMPAAVPADVIAVDAFPLLASGKVDTRALAVRAAAAVIRPSGNGGLDRGDYVPPASDVEATIQRIWADVLQIDEELSVDTDFFKAGGNSLRAGVLTAALRSALNLPRLPATAVYQAKTVRGMAELAEHWAAKAAASSTSSAPPGMLTSSGSSSACGAAAAAVRLHADDASLALLPSQSSVVASMPYWSYLLVQYLMLALTMVMVPVIWGALLVVLFALRPTVGVWALVALWPALQLGALLGYAVMLVALKWALVQRLKPGVHPLHGWMYGGCSRACASLQLCLIATWLMLTHPPCNVYSALGDDAGAAGAGGRCLPAHIAPHPLPAAAAARAGRQHRAYPWHHHRFAVAIRF